MPTLLLWTRFGYFIGFLDIRTHRRGLVPPPHTRPWLAYLVPWNVE